ncbi:DUF7507 domain-containing protein [Mesorhizobium sp. 1B3]|uniref:DUF7507 domain-containing protein n=1 Tax=Mesorhizobium sp. 1B3 TaxID=3243599 RepID=UPI003D96F56C
MLASTLAIAEARAAEAPAQAWPSAISGGGSTDGATRTFTWGVSPYGDPGVTATQTITSITAAQSACDFMAAAPSPGSGVRSQPNYLTYSEPDIPTSAFMAGNCVALGNGFVSSLVLSKPLIAPIFHFHNLDSSRFAITGTSTTGASVGLQTIVKNDLLDVSGNTLNNTVQFPTVGGCNDNNTTDGIAGACGSFRVIAASGLIQSLSLNNNALPPNTGNESFNWALSFPTAPLAKQFSPTTIRVGETSQLTFSIANPNESASVTLTPLDFTDNLPAGLTLAAATATNNGSCGSPSVTNGAGGALAVGATSVRATNISVAPGATCTITVSVTASSSGNYINDTSNMSTSVGNLIPGGSTTLTVTLGSQTPFTCSSNMYLAQNTPTQLFRFDTSSNPFVVSPVGSASPVNYNAAAYNPVDNYIYALDTSANLIRIGAGGGVLTLGAVTNLPGTSIAGEIGPDGTYYVINGARLYRINLTTRVASSVALSRSINVQDLAWHDGRLYAAEFAGALLAINPTNGNVTDIGTSTGVSGSFGGMFGATNGVFGSNNSGGFYKFDLTTGVATLISNLQGSSSNDGAKCVTTPLDFPADLSITKDDGVSTYTPGLDATYTIVVTNNGPFGVQGAHVSDPLPTGVTTASWTCGSATGGAQCSTASGTGAIDTTANLPAGSSVTYTLSMSVPASQTGSFTNTATVTPPDGTSDSDTSNNTASDTDTMELPPVSGACSPRAVPLGSTFSLAPFAVSGSVQKTGSWNSAPDPWTTTGGNYSITWNFSQPVPAHWLQVAVIDVNPESPAASLRITLGAGSTATVSDFAVVQGDLSYNPATGTLTRAPTVSGKQAAALQARNTTNTITSITITGNNIVAGDSIMNRIYVRPPCLTVSKVSEEGTGSFQIDMTNVGAADGSAAASTTLTTTTAGTAVSSPMYFARDTRTDLVLSEVVPAGWSAQSAVCTDQNAGNTGNPAVIGSFASPTLTIPAANVRPESAIQCVFTNEIANPALTIDKTGTFNDLDGDGLLDAGETITYSFEVENTGNVTLTDVTVNDPLLTDAGISVSPGPQTLTPGGSVTFTATYTPTQAEIDAGRVENTATGTGTPPSGPPTESPPDTVVVPPDQTPALSIEKTGTLNDLDGDGLLDPGETVTFTFRVTNTGTVTMTNVTPNDPLLQAAGVSVTPGPQTLAPGGAATFTATYTPTQAEIDAGKVENTATGTGTPPSGPPVESPPDTVVVPPDQTPRLLIEKTGTLNDSDGDGLIDLGETISYSFRVQNTGTVTLTNVTVNDQLLTAAGLTVTPGPQTLAPGGIATFTATYTPTQADIDAGRVENTATGTGTPPSGPPIESPPDTVTVPPDQTPGLTIEKTGTLNDADGDGLIDLGETISYSFLVKNTGTVTLTGVTVDDPLLTAAGLTVTPGPQTLAPGGTATFTATYTPTQADIDAGRVENTATGTGTPPSGPPIESPPDTVVVPPDQTSGLTIEKTGTLNDGDGDGLIDLGETISYSFRVQNTGTVTLTGVTVNDPLLQNAGVALDQGPQTLAPGAIFTFTATYTPTQADIDAGRVENTATGTGTPPSGPPIESPPDTVIVPPDQTPRLTIEKTGTLNDSDGDGLIDLGETISYSFRVQNTGTVTMTNVTVNDPLLSNAGISVTPGPQTLAPGGVATFTATYTPTQADIDAGNVENTATGTGTPPSGPPVESPPDTVIVPPDQAPRLAIEKTGTLNDIDGDGLIDLGETISYSFRVQNTGTVTMTGVTVNDPLLQNAGISVTPGPQTLAPGGVATFTATYTPDQADIDAGKVENTATGIGTPPSGPPVESPPDTVVVPPDQTPGLTIEKTGTLNDSDGDGLIDLGETISYSFVARNTGNVTLTNVTVNDPLLQNAGIAVTPGPQTLAPRGSITFTAIYTPDQADIDAGRVENTATGTGTPPSGPPTESPPDTVVVPPDQTPALTIEKTGRLNDADGDGLIDLGETITYSFLVRNTGTVTLTNVTVDDPLLADAGITVSPGPQTLAPRGSVTFTATYTPDQADIDAGRVENTATGTGTPPSGPPTESPPDTVVVPPDQASSMTIEKTGTLNDADGDGLIDLGETISYSFRVQNTGAVTLTDVTVNDPLLANAGITVTPGPQTLAPGGVATFTATYTPDQADIDAGRVENTATGTGTPPSGPPTESPPDTVVVPPDQATGLTIEKTGTLNDGDGDGLLDAGETISYSFLVRNTGAVTMTNVTVNDPLLANAGISVTPGPQTLAPGGTATFTATYTPTQAEIDAGRVENTATGTGTPPSGPPTESPPDTVVVPPDQATGMTIEKTATLNDRDGDDLLDFGETITYSFLVENTGAVTLSGVTVDDPMLARAGVALDQAPQTLAPGATFTFTATYTPTQADIDAGRVENTATATGTNPGGDPIGSPPDTVVTLPQPASLVLQKTGRFGDVDGNGHASLGDTLTYTFTVTNDGGQTVTNVWPVDAGPTFNGQPAGGALSRFSPEPVTLAPGQSQAFTATYTLTERDIENAAGVSDGVANKATATGRSGSGGEITSHEATSVVTMPAAVPSDITVTKVANLRFIRRGEQAPFTIRVTNNSAARAAGLTIVDTMPSGFRFVEGTATIGGVKVTPEISGRQIRFPDVSVDGKSEVEIRLRLLALSTAGPGEHVNLAHAEDPAGNRISDQARAIVEIIVEPVFDCGDIIGKVFDDINRNGYQDEGEPGLPGVRVATVKGWLITTDEHGRFHVACADLPEARIGSNFIMKLDERTLPTGYRLTTENPRVVRLTAGKMTELNFGASIGRVVRLDLADQAFLPGDVELQERWAEGIDQLIAVLAQEQSILRLTYLDPGSDAELAEARVKHIKELIAERWRQRKRSYPLEIETRVEAGQ